MSQTGIKKNRTRVTAANSNRKQNKAKKKGAVSQKELEIMVRNEDQHFLLLGLLSDSDSDGEDWSREEHHHQLLQGLRDGVSDRGHDQEAVCEDD